ncbi:hypothetical protein [Staphylococcus equorum]|uniref:hypothetical protein n=1 Tax=Staphylococcus equorum TaxID=246432 RepID=UPI0007047EE3|nr:hypothetical protein [Staphylococcus equorum]ALM56951.1 hypothetical protein SE1039_11680 [Staphylococcus equorum]
MRDNKISRPKEFDLQNREERQILDSKQLKKASGSYEFGPDSNSIYEEVSNMSEFIERKEFEQFEKRIDNNFNNLNSKIDNLPSTFEDKIEKHVSNAKFQLVMWIIGTSIATGSLLIGAIGLGAKLLGIY